MKTTSKTRKSISLELKDANYKHGEVKLAECFLCYPKRKKDYLPVGDNFQRSLSSSAEQGFSHSIFNGRISFNSSTCQLPLFQHDYLFHILGITFANPSEIDTAGFPIQA
ncbi:hypothetical protein LIER_07241 [Lithospermum erythrorhizon]|uniref:Uncharacterized protein n=1 Tax=Lithospermum erythrorhizon TaxID=34254 RepID=A0AAV3P8G3_LITER